MVIAHACTGNMNISGGCGGIWLVAAAQARHFSCAVALPCAAVSMTSTDARQQVAHTRTSPCTLCPSRRSVHRCCSSHPCNSVGQAAKSTQGTTARVHSTWTRHRYPAATPDPRSLLSHFQPSSAASGWRLVCRTFFCVSFLFLTLFLCVHFLSRYNAGQLTLRDLQAAAGVSEPAARESGRLLEGVRPGCPALHRDRSTHR